MSIEEKIQSDLKEAMKAREADKVTLLRTLVSEIKNVRINQQKEDLEDTDIITVLKKQVKQRQESLEQFKSAGRDELAAKEEAELAIIDVYLPEALSEEDLRKVIDQAISSTGASSMADMGNVMKEVKEKTGGSADGKLASQIVRYNWD